ncbi:MAG: TadE/TadG family type IV pilus assembly protein [Caulobacteraceae bacterium]
MFDLLRRFWRHRRANVAVTFAIAILPITLMVGMGVDITNATRLKLSLQDSADAAALALARQGPTITDAQITPLVTNYIQSSFNNSTTTPFTVTNATLDRTTITATVDATAKVPANFAKLLGVTTIPVSVHSVAKGMLLEIALVLDTSGSMSESAGSGGSKISALKTASSSFLDSMFGPCPRASGCRSPWCRSRPTCASSPPAAPPRPTWTPPGSRRTPMTTSTPPPAPGSRCSPT